MERQEDSKDSSFQNQSAQDTIEMDQELSDSSSLVHTVTNVSNIQVTSKNAIHKGILDTSIDSGIHDVAGKVETNADEDFPTTGAGVKLVSNAEQSNVKENATNVDVENVRAKEDITDSNDKDMTELCHIDSVGKVDTSINEQNESKISAEKEKGMQDNSNVDDTGKVPSNIENDLGKNKPVKSVEANKDMDVAEKCQPGTVVDDAQGESLGNTMMEYRTGKKVNAGDDGSSDSSPDSSDSDSDHDDKTTGAKDTEAQINKIISNEREASPEREKRVKLNRHGFEDIRTKGELSPEDLPPLEELTITVDESVVMVEVGSIKSIVGILVVIQSNENVPPLDDETILFVKGHKVLGQVFEVFGPVKTPWYSVRFNVANNIEAKGLEVGMPVYCAPREDSFTKFVFVDSLKRVKGSDASWEDNNEPPEKHLDYSDDESERRAKAKRRNKKFGDNEAENGEDGESGVQKKNPRQRNRNRPNRDNQSGLGPQQQTQHPKRGWNPFKGNQNEESNSGPPRYGGGHQDHHNNSHSNGQRWPHGQNNFNRPQSRFGGPPNFQNRPRMGQNQGQQQYGSRNNQHQSSWRPPINNNFPNNLPNSGQNSLTGPSPSNNPFNMQGTAPAMATPNFGPPKPVQNHPQTSMNVDFSQPPPQFQQGNQIRPPNQQTGMSPWMGPQVGMPQQNPPFMATKLQNQNNQLFSQGNQSINQHQGNVGNQMYNQGQPVNSTAFQSNQPTISQPSNAFLQSNMGNFQNFGMNNGQNPFNQPLQNNFQSNQTRFQTNVSGQSNFSSNDPNKCVVNGPNFVQPVSGSVQFTGTNPCNNPPSNTQGPAFSNFQMQNIQGQTGFNNSQNSENTSFVQNQNLINNQQQGSVQSNISGNHSNQFVPPQGYGFQSNVVSQNQPAGQGGFNQGSNGSIPYSGSNLMPNGSNTGYNQMNGNIQPNVITDQRFIQNNS